MSKNATNKVKNILLAVTMLFLCASTSPSQAYAGDPSYEETMQWIKTAMLSANGGDYRFSSITWNKVGHMNASFKSKSRPGLGTMEVEYFLSNCDVIKKSTKDKDGGWIAGCTGVGGFESEKMAGRFAKAWHHAFLKTKPSSLF